MCVSVCVCVCVCVCVRARARVRGCLWVFVGVLGVVLMLRLLLFFVATGWRAAVASALHLPRPEFSTRDQSRAR